MPGTQYAELRRQGPEVLKAVYDVQKRQYKIVKIKHNGAVVRYDLNWYSEEKANSTINGLVGLFPGQYKKEKAIAEQ